ncbi:hypothetical protein SAICODRAFT_33649 [Saitoella complicata NRRL Y-17804]|uniref:VLRF1 domain-containing protein n=1 Tax=Saitoella complicata (strain BCRC 22490 / CBS 7301 / JCM 7358 / NBRC 10748 / NRRL Y-17804) TaxID=698492 RepID=A0A0E9NP39_SAICN|nr:uncharacterized protein SAICODRAFT_33649 [Saitoella complicata NRRL Y-17804]ODQ55003.1 hypothetical protein SAICODRAFT_33649 [Saitoella complicata NRRL Y-17804]GAO51568.1 hypothetical protein G7K_5667-t1 [Saitoella complicata NRRL Y-17804]
MATAQDKPRHPLLQKPLYVYSLPAPILDTLTLADGSATPIAAPTSEEPEAPTDDNGKACALCRVESFAIVQDRRAHYKSMLHTFNVKRSVAGEKTVEGEEFEKMLENLNESLSGSESSGSEDEEESAMDEIAQLLRKHATVAPLESLEDRSMKQNKSPLMWLSSSALDADARLGIYRALLTQDELDAPLDSIRKKQIPTPAVQYSARSVAMIMIGGGHFAAMIVSCAPKQGGEVAVLAHKTFHRYTTRRKQGGAQSANDAAKGAAHSAGASIRRYNEAALRQDIRDLLASWKGMMDKCELVFIRATGTENRRALFGYDEAVVKANDPRIRGFPFTTRRPTQSELIRCFQELTRVKVSTHVEKEVQKPAKDLSKKTTAKAAVGGPPKASAEETKLLEHTGEITSLIKRSKASALLAYLKQHSLSPDFKLHPANHHTPNILHFASASSSPATVTALLKEGADPTIENTTSKTAFEIACSREVRDAFRITRGELGEQRWDWSAARIPPAISKADAEKRIARERELKEREDRAAREANLKQLEEDERTKRMEQRVKKVGVGKTLGVKTSLSEREQGTQGLSEEMKKKIERERRAAAAEARIKAMQQG